MLKPVPVGEVVDAAAQDVVLGNDFLDVEASLTRCRPCAGRTAVEQGLSDRLVRARAGARRPAPERCGNVIIERRRVQMGSGWQPSNLLAPGIEQWLALTLDEVGELLKICDFHGFLFLHLASNTSIGLRSDLDLAFDLDWNVERQLGHTDRAARVAADLRSEHLEHEIRKTIDDGGLLDEPGCGVDHAKNPRPRRDAIEIPESAAQAAEDGERRKAGSGVSLFDREVASYFPSGPAIEPSGLEGGWPEMIARVAVTRTNRMAGQRPEAL